MQKENNTQKALRLHQENPVIDVHLDLAGEIYIRNLTGEREVIRRHYLEHWKRAGMNLIVSSVYLESERLPENGLADTLNQIAALYEDVDSLAGEVSVVKSAAEIKQVVEKGKIGILLYLEGLDILTESPLILRSLYEMGVRGASLTWSRKNALGQGSCPAGEIKEIPGGLTELGRETVRKLEELHMFLDVSHLNDEGFYEIAKIASRPFLATHSNARGVQPGGRNLSDKQLGIIAEKGGVIGVNAHKKLVGESAGKAGTERLCDHIEYLIEKAGADHVGIGLDLCDSYEEAAFHLGKPEGRKGWEFFQKPSLPESGDCLKNHEELLKVTEELLRREVAEEDIIKFLGGNFLRYLLRI